MHVLCSKLGFGDDDLLHSLQHLDSVPEADDEIVGDGGERVGGVEKRRTSSSSWPLTA